MNGRIIQRFVINITKVEFCFITRATSACYMILNFDSGSYYQSPDALPESCVITEKHNCSGEDSNPLPLI